MDDDNIDDFFEEDLTAYTCSAIDCEEIATWIHYFLYDCSIRRYCDECSNRLSLLQSIFVEIKMRKERIT